jgi:hypothetical protein
MCHLWHWHTKRAQTPLGCYDYGVIKRKAMAVVPGFTFNEETEMISALYSAVALMKRYEEESVDNKSYWRQRIEDYTNVADKFSTACRNAIYNA